MVQSAQFALAIFGGIVLGLVFYGGLWLTVKKGLHRKAGGIYFLLSFLIRTLAVMGGFYLLSFGNWKNMMLILAGFILSRILFGRYFALNAEMRVENKKA